MNKIQNTPCRKCGGNTSLHYEEPERSSGMDIRPLKRGGLKKICRVCSYEEFVSSLDEDTNTMLAEAARSQQ